LEAAWGFSRGTLGLLDISYFTVGIFFSFVFGYLAVKFLVSYLSKHGLGGFVWYRIFLAGLVLLMLR
jgi:undecaprenyl pyrophosphate phosphatase UppP